MKFFNGLTSLDFSWVDVAAALFKRYPNPYSKHVLSEDVLDRYVKDGKLHTVKLLTKTNALPRWGERFYKGPNYICVVEESVVDPVGKTFTTYSRNITMTKFMCCTEKCVYKADAKSTLVEKSAWLESHLGYGLRIPVLEFSIQRYKSNQHKATMGLQYVIEQPEKRSIKDIMLQSKEKFSEAAKHSQEIITHKAKLAKEIAKSKAELAKVKAERAKLKTDELVKANSVKASEV